MKKRVRLYNFIIDSLIFFVLVLLAAIILRDIIDQKTLRYIMIVFYYFYYLILESVFGQTIGKMVTKTKVVDAMTGEKPAFIKIVARTVTRLIPIDFLSYLFVVNGIHDKLSKTIVTRV
ncbi:RDD family protein [Flavobacterium algicola]|uniref:RDD family protein n=1 Tax=Flavobacterium algicola TaxID=556529 RepID=UPI001EFEABBE|nr:RDD family protein [Flavobacterium algicola]MCG9791041.1 RDD family protein [Flavobacterium algicola]